jgi:DeoR/GlpR family transcriptional regulator of sugar metabolism
MDRIAKILDLLAVNKKVKITLLAEILGVSYVTLRRDLEKLEKRGILRHIHGFATLDGADETGKRIAFNYLVKKKIAKAAAQTVEEGESILLESGSCCALFAEELAISKKNVTIITNSVFTANFIGKQNIVKIILLGGFLQPESQMLVGPMTVKCAENVFSDKFFLGADGFVPSFGFTGRDHLSVETAGELAKRAKKVYILTESAKFQRHGAFNLLQFDKITGVFTDDKIPKEAEIALINNGISLNKAPSVEEKINWRRFQGQPPFLFTEKEG